MLKGRLSTLAIDAEGHHWPVVLKERLSASAGNAEVTFRLHPDAQGRCFYVGMGLTHVRCRSNLKYLFGDQS